VQPISATFGDGDVVGEYFAKVADDERRAFVALNTALFADGACVVIAAGVRLEPPVHLRFLSTGDGDARPVMSHPRVLLVVDDGGQVAVVESYTGPDGVEYLTNAVTEIVAGADTTIDHRRVEAEGDAAHHVCALYTAAAPSARCSLETSGGRAAFAHSVTEATSLQL
jgi:Fe-S cluster assembly protein SufD